MTKSLLTAEDVEFLGLSFTDLNGRLFRWQGELYRGIPKQSSAFYSDLFERGIIDELINKRLLVETAVTDIQLEGFDLVIWHRTVSPLIYPHEWSDQMLGDAAEKQIAFTKELHRHNLTCGDAHPLNLVFDGTDPLFVDLGSIVRLNTHRDGKSWHKQDQFRTFFINPLRLMTTGQDRMARWVLREHPNDDDLTSVELLLKPTLLSRAKAKVAALFQRYTGSGKAESLDRLQSEVRMVTHAKPAAIETQPDNPPLRQVLARLNPVTVLDASIDNDGMSASAIACELGSRVVVVSADTNRVNSVYKSAKAQDLQLTPMVLDLISPSHDLANYWYMPARQRLKSELVVAFGVLDAWVLGAHVRIEVVVDRLAALTNRWLLLDFTQRASENLPTWSSDRLEMFDDYNLDSVRRLLEEVFASVTTIPATGSGRTVWLLCELADSQRSRLLETESDQ